MLQEVPFGSVTPGASQFRPDWERVDDISCHRFFTGEFLTRVLSMAAKAESSTTAAGKAKAAQDSAVNAGYELPWYTQE